MSQSEEARRGPIALRKGRVAAAISCQQRAVEESFCVASFKAIDPDFTFSTAVIHPVAIDNRFA